MIAIILPALLCQTSQPPEGVLTVSAGIEASELQPGGHYAIDVQYDIDEQFSAAGAGVPGPLLQIDVPSSVTLLGPEALSLAELRKTGFVDAPYERVLEKAPARIDFEYVGPAGHDKPIYLNFMAYIQGGSDEESYFVRRRLELPVAAGARAKTVEPTQSDWGVRDVLQIGDKLTTFELPRANGETVSLSKYLGKKNIVITTYRAHW